MASKRMHTLVATAIRVLGSRRFFHGVMVFFVFEALWAACSALYPMAFDEEFHVGVIKLFSHQWLPFFSEHPAGADSFGAIARDPSYLYHYLMSFPYRLLSLITDNQVAHVMLLRLINVGIFAWALVLFHKVLLRAGSSKALTNTALLLFVLIPIVPLVAGQAGYDPLCLLLVAVTCLLAERCATVLRQHTIDVRSMGLLLLTGLAGSITKYASVPIFLAAVVYVSFELWRAFRGRWPQFRSSARNGYRVLNTTTKVTLGISIALAIALCAERYVVNIVQYHTPINRCETILSEDQCEAFGPWRRNQDYAAVKSTFDTNSLHYSWRWLQGLHYRLFFMINGPHPNYTNYPPLPLPAATAVVIVIAGAVAVILYWRKVFRGRPFLGFLLLATVLYTAFLFIDAYNQFMYTGQTVAINGRYLLLVLLPLAAVLGRALSTALRDWRWLKLAMAGLAIILFLQGGGVLSFIARSDQAWYWPNSTIVIVNQHAQRLVTPLIFRANSRD